MCSQKSTPWCLYNSKCTRPLIFKNLMGVRESERRQRVQERLMRRERGGGAEGGEGGGGGEAPHSARAKGRGGMDGMNEIR
jgi:hypothetical protein